MSMGAVYCNRCGEPIPMTSGGFHACKNPWLPDSFPNAIYKPQEPRCEAQTWADGYQIQCEKWEGHPGDHFAYQLNMGAVYRFGMQGVMPTKYDPIPPSTICEARAKDPMTGLWVPCSLAYKHGQPFHAHVRHEGSSYTWEDDDEVMKPMNQPPLPKVRGRRKSKAAEVLG